MPKSKTQAPAGGPAGATSRASTRGVKEGKVLPSTTARVMEQTPDYINDRIREKTEASVVRFAIAGPEAIRQRLDELDREWDIERFLEVNASVVVLTGLALGLVRDRRWLIVPILASGFLLQHALEGWCPPVPILRRLGTRTSAEIEHERYALKALRGDFQHLEIPSQSDRELARQTLQAVRA